jgi:hypothetical protein
MSPFNDFRRNVHSQSGEDGVIEEILRRLEGKVDIARWCVEFGAWDGKHLSNTFKLVQEGWNAVYIEGDSRKFVDLQQTCKEYAAIVPVNAMVSPVKGETNSLDFLLSETPLPAEYDLLSIDIDSYDLAVWEAYEGKPKIVVIEVNSTALPGLLWWHSDLTDGNTFSSTLNVGRNKGYNLVCHTGNMIFVRDDLVEHLNIEEKFLACPELLFDYSWTPEHSRKVGPAGKRGLFATLFGMRLRNG